SSCCARSSPSTTTRSGRRSAAPRRRSARPRTGQPPRSRPPGPRSPAPRPRFAVERSRQRQVTERFFAAAGGGDVNALMELLSPDVTLWTDGGGKVRQARRAVVGAGKGGGGGG